MIYPKFINEEDIIGVPAPSDGAYCEEDITRFKNAKMKWEELNYHVRLSKNIFCSKRGRSGDTKTRAEEINSMFQDETIKTIICAAGGEFLTEIIPFIQFEELTKTPKWVVGFSDPTGIIFPLTTKYDIATIYGNNFKSFGATKWHSSLNDSLEILRGNLLTQHSYELYENEREQKITRIRRIQFNR